MDKDLLRERQQERYHVHDPQGRQYVFDLNSGIYKSEDPETTGNVSDKQKSPKLPWYRQHKLRRKWVAVWVPIIVNIATLGVICAYTYYAAQQVGASEVANDEAAKATRYSGRSLQLTFDKLERQIESANKLARASQANAEQAAKQAIQTTRLATAAQAQAIATRTLAVATQAVNRPYLAALIPDPFQQISTAQTTLTIATKNFGAVPAMTVRTSVRAYINNWVAIPVGLPPKSDPTTIMPGQLSGITLTFNMPEAQVLRSPANGLTLCVTYSYKDPKDEKISYTQTQEFSYAETFPISTTGRIWSTASACPEKYQ